MIPILVAHRGYMEKYPENTLSALGAALEAGACLIEFDIQMDAARQLILLHDDSFKRTGNSESSVFALREYAGISVHEPKRFAASFEPEPVPLLTQAIELLMQYPESTAFVEIKQESIDRWGMEAVVDEVLSCTDRAGQQCVIIADNLDALLYARSTSGTRIGWVIHRYDERHRLQAGEHVPDFMICNYRRISAELWQGGWQWMLYDISDPALALEWARKGAQLIETRDIGGMLQHSLLRQRACRQRKDPIEP
jgi:glycerophosphoryl diester phosphodiesterase